MGRIKRLTRIYANQYSTKEISKEKILKGNKIQNGYLQVKLIKNNIIKSYLIHRLVAQAFLENLNNYEIVNHKDEIKTNNEVSNLEWCDAQYNNTYGTKQERLSKNHSLKGPETTKKEVFQLSKNNVIINKFRSITEASNKTKIKICNISQCALGQRKTAGGYIWRYEN